MSNWWDSAPLADAKTGETVIGKKGDYTFSIPGNQDEGGKWWESAPLAKDAKKEVPDAVRPFVGANRFIADVAGAPVDAATFGINKASQGVTALANKALGTDYEAPQIKDPIGGSESIKKAMGALPMGGANPDDVRPAATPGEKILEEAGSGAASLLVPGLGAEAILARTWKAGESFGNMALGLIKGSGAASNTAMGAAGGALGEIAAEAAPDEYKTLARMGGNIAGGVGVGLGQTAAEGAVKAGTKGIQALTEPAEMRAARTLNDRAANPGKLRQDLIEAAETPEIVPGSKPTTFQATGDLGVGALEREVSTNQGAVERFAQRRADQNRARTENLEKLADPQADSGAFTDYVRTRLRDLTETHANRVSNAARDVSERLAQAGGDAFDNPAAYGEALRTPLAALHQETKDAVSGLWRAIDPDMTTLVNPQGLKTTTAEQIGRMSKAARPPEGEEAAIYKTINSLGENSTDFGDMVALRSRLTDEMRSARKEGNTQALRRLTMTLQSVDDTLAKTAGDIAADPARRETLYSSLKREADAYAAEQGAADARISARGGPGEGDGGVAPVDAGGLRPAPGVEGQAGGQPGLPAGDSGLPPTGIAPDVAERYAAAREGTRDLKNTYESGSVGAVLAPGPQYGSFRTTASNVARRLFDKPEDLKAFVEAAKGNPEALAPMKDYAAFSLRQAAVRDGLLSPQKYQQWMDRHGYVFEQFPELAGKFKSVKDAQRALDESLVAQKQALTDYETSTVTRLLAGEDPAKAVGRALSKPGEFQALVNTAKSDPAATAGLKRATVDYMLGIAKSTAEAGTSGLEQIKADALQKFFLNNRKTLAALFSPEELSNIANVSADLQRANRSIVAVKIPGGSNTAQDTAGRAVSVLKKLVSENMGRTVGAVVGGTAGGGLGAAGGVAAGGAVDALISARNLRIDSVLADMMLDPKMAAVWLMKIPEDAGPSLADSVMRRLRAVAADQVTQAIDRENRK